MLDYTNFAATPAASVSDKVFKPGELTFGLLTPPLKAIHAATPRRCETSLRWPHWLMSSVCGALAQRCTLPGSCVRRCGPDL